MSEVIKARLFFVLYGEIHEVLEMIKDFNTLRSYAKTLCNLDPDNELNMILKGNTRRQADVLISDQETFLAVVRRSNDL